MIILVITVLILFGMSSCYFDTSVFTDDTSAYSEKTEYSEEASETESFLSEFSTSEYGFTQSETTAEVSETAAATTAAAKAISYGGMDITMLDVGQGLGILIEADGEYMIYDGGGRERSSYVVAYLKNHNVNNLKYMFVSHYDEDHIAGLVGVLNRIAVRIVIDLDYTADTKIYDSFKAKLVSNGAEEIHPDVGDTFSLGKANITVIGPKYYYEDENSRSICIRIDYGTFSCIITGDSEADAESDMVFSGQNLDCDLYVAGHHGRSSSSSSDFVKEMSPAYAFISSGEGNPYGHPAERTLKTLKNNGVQIFRSDKQGEVTCHISGSRYSFSQEPCNNYSAGFKAETTAAAEKQTTVKTPEISPDENGHDYVLNKNTKKFHYSYCSSVNQMSDKNKEFYHGTRNEVIARGFVPCQRCNP